VVGVLEGPAAGRPYFVDHGRNVAGFYQFHDTQHGAALQVYEVKLSPEFLGVVRELLVGLGLFVALEATREFVKALEGFRSVVGFGDAQHAFAAVKPFAVGGFGGGVARTARFRPPPPIIRILRVHDEVNEFRQGSPNVQPKDGPDAHFFLFFLPFFRFLLSGRWRHFFLRFLPFFCRARFPCGFRNIVP